MELKYLEQSEFELWNKFVDQSPQGSIFSKTWYLDALQVEYKILSVQQNGEIKAGIVLTKNEIGAYSNPMFDKYLGVLYSHSYNKGQKELSEFYEITVLLAKEVKKYKSFDYYFHPYFLNWIPFYWQGFSQQTRYTYIINLKKLISDIEKNFHLNIKRNIKNALKSSIKINKMVESEQLFNLINKTFLRQGSSAPFNKKKFILFIENMIQKNSFESFGAYNNGKLISVAGFVFDARSSYLLINGLDIENEIRGANALLIFEAIKFFKDKVEYFDFEGSMLPGVEQFYRRFGGELTPYMRIWNDNFFNYVKTKVKKLYKKLRYGR